MAIETIAKFALSTIPSFIQGITGGKQSRAAKNLKKNDFIPPSLNESLMRAKMLAGGTKFPGQKNIEENIRSSTAGTINRAGAGSLSDKLAVAGAADKQEKEALSDVGDIAANFALDNERSVQNILGNKANLQYENELRFQDEKRQLRDAGTQNIFNAAKNIGTLGIEGLGGTFSGGMNIDKLIADNPNPASIQSMIDNGLLNVDSLAPNQRMKLMNYLMKKPQDINLSGSPSDILPVSNYG